MAHAIVEPVAMGYEVKCTRLPGAHTVGPYRSRDKAVTEWNRLQKERDEDEGA